MRNNLPDNIKECFILELRQILPFATYTYFFDGIRFPKKYSEYEK